MIYPATKEGECYVALNRGYNLLINTIDLPIIRDGGPPWYVHESFTNEYAVRHIRIGPNKRYKQYAHRLITKCPPGQVVDHKNHNGLDCTRNNLRIVGYSKNNQNRSIWKPGADGYRGVRKNDSGTYQARIQADGVRENLGSFKTSLEAAKAYDIRALELFGEFAWTNLDRDLSPPVTPKHDIPF